MTPRDRADAVWNSAEVRLGLGMASSPLSLTTSATMVAAEHPLAVSAGLDILAEGGTAADAAIATAFTLGVVDPGASGVGGGGYLLYRQVDGTTTFIDFSMRAPTAAVAGCYDVLPHAGASRFGWRAVAGDQNIVGPRAVAVPGMVAGMGEIHHRFGRRPWMRLLGAATQHASEGVAASWTTSLRVVSKASALSRWDASAEVLMPGGLPLRCSGTYGDADTLRQPDLAATLEAIAVEGPDALARGSVARRLGGWLEANGGLITSADFAEFQPIESSPIESTYRSHRLYGPAAPGGTVTAQQILGVLDLLDLFDDDVDPIRRLEEHILAARLCFAERSAVGSRGMTTRAELEQLLSRDHLEALAAQVRTRRPVPPTEASAADSTTHLAVIDADGNVAAMTLTLADNFGSAVTVPGTGVMMNNAMQWHDPVPDRPCSVGPGEPGLNNLAPLVVESPDGDVYAIGSAGGVRIIDAVTQIVQSIASGHDPQTAVDAPRLDCSGLAVLVDPRLAPIAAPAAAALGVELVVRPDELHTHHYSRPIVVSAHRSGIRRAGVDPARLAAVAGW